MNGVGRKITIYADGTVQSTWRMLKEDAPWKSLDEAQIDNDLRVQPAIRATGRKQSIKSTNR